MASFLLGPIYAPPAGLSTSDGMQSVTDSLVRDLESTLRHGRSPFGSFIGNTSSVSVGVVSTQEEATPLVDYHFTSDSLNTSAGSTDRVTSTSVYRIGSISKLFTVYALLVNYGWSCWDHGVTRYVPELRRSTQHGDCSAVDSVEWDRITVGSLASQLSGIGRDYANGDLYSWIPSGPALGLPQLPPSDIPTCGGNSTLPPCDRQEFFRGMTKRHPVFAPQTTPVYSNLGYRLLGYILEKLSGSRYDSLLQSSVFEPLGMSHTTARVPSGEGSWVIPDSGSVWFQDVGDEMPTAGIYSTSADLAKFGSSILSNRQLSALDVRRWMKPDSHTASLVFSVGSPWEIWRTRSNVSSGRTVDVYTKSGGLGEYASQLLLIPDYGVSISVLVAGSSSGTVVGVVTEMLLQSLIPALEREAIRQACRSVCGTYESPDGSRNSSIAIGSDDSGLVIESWINNGFDLKSSIQEYAASTGSPPVQAFRLQATNLETGSACREDKEGHGKVAYRASFETGRGGAGDAHVIMDPDAKYWGLTDQSMYGEVAIDDFVMHMDKTGTAIRVEPRVVRDVLHRVTRRG